MSSVGVRVGQVNLIFCRELLTELPGELSESLSAICAPLPGGIIHLVEESCNHFVPASLKALGVFRLERTVDVVSDHESIVEVRVGLVKLDLFVGGLDGFFKDNHLVARDDDTS